MSQCERPAVQRAQPPKAPYAVVNRVMWRMLSFSRTAGRMCIRINVDRMPTHQELVEAARRDRLSVIYPTPNAGLK